MFWSTVTHQEYSDLIIKYTQLENLHYKFIVKLT